ncbi:ciliary microtubule inner protein 2C-like [Antedon mediterranea]|uniref:ciliary microtubule inner protein 2C-like n=1 Tax=Antedon mediterranea TaxID=105859 RepID=UPI003AF4FAC6
MSKAAGTLTTTHQATYIPPKLMPGYKGHCPTLKYDYGETYGNATAKYFQDYRSKTLNTSQTNYANGGQFPTVYTHNPDLVIPNRERTRERWRTAPPYSLNNVQHDRQDQLQSFDKLAQQHRDHYKDRTGTVGRVDEFLIPKKAEDMYKQDAGQVEEKMDVLLEANSRATSNKSVLRPPTFHTPNSQSSVRDREMRDVHFERR